MQTERRGAANPQTKPFDLAFESADKCMAATIDIHHRHSYYKNSSGDEIANVNFYAVRPEATRIL